MSDYGHNYTSEQIIELDTEITLTYHEAAQDLQKKLDDFNEKYTIKEAIHAQDVKDGKWTQEQFENWKSGQVFQSEQWKNKRDQMVNTVVHANDVAMQMINNKVPNVFAVNASYMNYSLEQSANVDFGFGLYDPMTVTRLLKDNPKMLPEWKINEKKDYVWNEKYVNKSVTQGILQGESIKQITKRVSDGLCASNENLMKTFSRTAMTGAQNAGRLESLKFAEDAGIDVMKQWMATLDSHTRDSHADVDGESVPLDSKFSNGLEYPGEPGGAPAEVYNCRCTMVGDLKKYPAKYKRYNNEKGKQIQYMTYDDWAKFKSYGKKGFTASQGGKGKVIDYSKYGGEESFKIMQKYGSYKEFTNKATIDEFETVWGAYNYNASSVADAFNSKDTKKDFKAYSKAQANEAKEELKKAQDNLSQIQKEIADKGADKKFEGIWYNQTITYADWENKKDSIQSKIDYYEQQIIKYSADGNQYMVDKMKAKLDEVKEFQKHGAEYSELLKKRDEANKLVRDLTPTKSGFNGDAYSQSRKDNAVWAKSPREADAVLRNKSGEVWRNATTGEREAIYEYTSSFHKFNEPLRGYEYGTNEYKGVGNTDLNAGYADNGKMLNDMTSIIDKSVSEQDMWFQRGCGYNGMEKFFNCDEDLLRYGTQEELESKLLGTTPTEFGFMSMGSSKGQGFSGNIILNIYTPAGTKMMYVEPFSAFGNGDGYSWDGISGQYNFGSELETILQQNTQFRVVKVERTGGTLYFDLDVIAQNKPQLWKRS